jgi:tRNA_anti-like
MRCGALEGVLAAMAFAAMAAGCADRLPDQDRRILAAAPQAKLSTDVLWKDYQADRRAADRKYWGKAVEVSGKVSSVSTDPPRIIFLQQEQPAAGIEARLLDDRAAATLAAASVGERLTLRCFCEGLTTNVVLKSCIKP